MHENIFSQNHDPTQFHVEQIRRLGLQVLKTDLSNTLRISRVNILQPVFNSISDK